MDDFDYFSCPQLPGDDEFNYFSCVQTAEDEKWTANTYQKFIDAKNQKSIIDALNHGIYRRENDEVDLMTINLMNNPLPADYGMPSSDEKKRYYELLNYNPVLCDLFNWQIENTKTYCPEMAMAFALSCISTACAGRWSVSKTLTTNLYLSVLAPTSVGKTQTMDKISEFMQLCGDEKRIGPDNFKSEGGMSQEVAQNPAKCFMLDELGFLMARIMSPRASATDTQIQRGLLKLFTAFGSGYAPEAKSSNKENNKTENIIKNPCPSIFGVSTPDVFWSSFSSREAGTGLLNRLIVMEASAIGNRKEPLNTQLGNSAALFATKIHRSFNHTPEGEMRITRVCRDLSLGDMVPEYFKSLNMIEEELIKSDEKYGNVYGRIVEITKRISIIFQLTENVTEDNNDSFNSMSIGLESARAAYNLVRYFLNYSYNAAVVNIKDNEIEKLQGVVFRVIDNLKPENSGVNVNYDGFAGKWVRERNVSRTSEFNGSKDTATAMKKLLSSGKIAKAQVKKKGGKKPTLYLVKPNFTEEFTKNFTSQGCEVVFPGGAD